MRYYLGVDGGGTKTYALITDEDGRIVGKGVGGNGNHQIDGDTARMSIELAVEQALQQAELTREEIAYAYFGLAGADRETDYRILNPMIASLGLPRFQVNCDTMIAMRAGTDRPYGVVLICGTGTNCAGVNEQGEFLQCGGFSYKYGDFGGGGSLSIEAFRTVIRAWDGREEQTLLTQLVLDELGYQTTEEMFHDFLDHAKPVPAELTKLLFNAADQGDTPAQTILRKQGEELGKAARAVIRQLNMGDSSFDVVLAGSVVTRGSGNHIDPYVEAYVKEAAPQANLAKLGIEPVAGAVWLAMEADGAGVSSGARERLERLVYFAQDGEGV